VRDVEDCSSCWSENLTEKPAKSFTCYPIPSEEEIVAKVPDEQLSDPSLISLPNLTIRKNTVFVKIKQRFMETSFVS
jgi:hypothetical protein